MLSQTHLLGFVCLSAVAMCSCAESPVTDSGMDADESLEDVSADRPESVLVHGGSESSYLPRDAAVVSSAVGAVTTGRVDAAVPFAGSSPAAVMVGMDAGTPSTQPVAPPVTVAPAAAAPPSPASVRAAAPTARDGGATGSASRANDAGVADARMPASSAQPVAEGAGARACDVPAEAAAEDVSSPTTVVGDGTAASCTSAAFVAAVAKGGVITFRCGADPVTITLAETAKIFNDRSERVVIDGGGMVTLSGAGQRRILYQNTCDEQQVWTTPHCDNQEFPQLTVQNLTFVGGSAKDQLGGGAIYAQGGRLKIINSRFVANSCTESGPDVGGGAVRATQQFQSAPVYVVDSTFGTESGRGNVCSNGGAISSSGASFTILNSTFRANAAVGVGANPAREGTPGGGNGGALYGDGNTFHVRVCGSTFEDNRANEGGGALFFVSNDRTGSLAIESSTLQRNPSGMFESHPGIFALAKGDPTFSDSLVR